MNGSMGSCGSNGGVGCGHMEDVEEKCLVVLEHAASNVGPCRGW